MVLIILMPEVISYECTAIPYNNSKESYYYSHFTEEGKKLRGGGAVLSKAGQKPRNLTIFPASLQIWDSILFPTSLWMQFTPRKESL